MLLQTIGLGLDTNGLINIADTILWNVSVWKAKTENETTSVTTHLRVRRPAARRVYIEQSMQKMQDVSYFRQLLRQ